MTTSITDPVILPDVEIPFREIRYDYNVPRDPNVEELTYLARWLTGEERKRREGKPSEWDQDVWVRTTEFDPEGKDVGVWVPAFDCGTPACAAGHTTLMFGGSPAFSDGDAWYRYPGPHRDLSDTSMIVNNEVVNIEAFAAERLGIDPNCGLFAGGNSWETMMEYIAYLIHGTWDFDVRQQFIASVGGNALPEDPDDE